MPRKDFRDSKTVARFLQLLEVYMDHPYEDLIEGYTSFMNKSEYRLKYELLNNHVTRFNHQFETNHLIHVCAYEGAMMINSPESMVDIERVISFFTAEYEVLKTRRNASKWESMLSDEGWDVLEESVVQKERDRDAFCKAKAKETDMLSMAIAYSMAACQFTSPDRWIEYDFLGDEYLDVIDSLEPDENEVFILKMNHPEMKQKDMAKLLGLTDGGVSRRMKRLKAKFAHLERKARRPKWKREKTKQ